MYVIAPGDTGLPEAVETPPPILSARYITPGSVDAELNSGQNFIDPPNECLVVRTGDAEAPPASTALLFALETTEQIVCKIGMHSKRVDAHLYLAATKSGPWVWNSDLIQGRYGYFLIGGPGRANLWRIRRAEFDFAGRTSFTIVPVAPSNGLPALNLASIHSDEMRQQIEQHWREFVEVFDRQLPFRTVNAAKDVCEYLMYDLFLRDETNPGRKYEFGDLLKRLHDRLQAGNDSSMPFSWIHFHLMQKIRLLHGRIHARRVASDGAITPEIALSVSTDLVEVLSAAGLTSEKLR